MNSPFLFATSRWPPERHYTHLTQWVASSSQGLRLLKVYSGQEICRYSAPRPPSCFVPLRCGKEDDLLFLSSVFHAWLTGHYFTERCSLSSHNGSQDRMLVSSFKQTPRCWTPPFSSVSGQAALLIQSTVKTQESHGFWLSYSSIHSYCTPFSSFHQDRFVEAAFPGWPRLLPYFILDKLCPGRMYSLLFPFHASHDFSSCFIGPQYPELELYVNASSKRSRLTSILV